MAQCKVQLGERSEVERTVLLGSGQLVTWAGAFVVQEMGVSGNSPSYWNLSSSASSWKRVILEKLTVSQPVNTFPEFYGTPLLLSVFRTSGRCRRLEPDRSNPHLSSLPHFSSTLIQQADSQPSYTSAPAAT
jgi:hypothetical protein